MLGSPSGPGGASQRGLWPIAPAPAPPTSGFTTDGFGRYGIYSLFPGGPGLSGALYSHASAIGRFASGISPSSGIPFHAAHKESLFSSAGYTFGTATPPPGSPYSPVAATQLEFLTKGYNSNIIIQPDFSVSPKKVVDKRCEDKCYQLKAEKTCGCQASPNKRFGDASTGCSRTNPIEWSPIHVKKEPLGHPCQVSEITTSGPPVVKIEVTSPTQKFPELSITTMPSVVTANGNIPVGIAVARQRVQHNEILSSPSLPPAGLLTTVNATTHLREYSRLLEADSSPGMAASTTAGVPGGGALLHCTDDRTAGLAGWSVGGSQSSITTPTLWQYPAALPLEPMVPLPVPPVGVQLVRDPTSGHLLLLPTTGIEQVQQAVIWPNYQQPPSLLLPPIPPPPLQLLTSTSSDYLSTSATLHQHTQTQSTRLLAVTTTDSKRKIPLPIPTATLIKIEADSSALDQTKALQTVSAIGTNGGLLTEQHMPPLVTTHVIYQHPTNLILPTAPEETLNRSQATSPVGCLTPQHEAIPIVEEDVPAVQDASNQTDTPICSEDDTTMHMIVEVVAEAKTKNICSSEADEDTCVPDIPKTDVDNETVSLVCDRDHNNYISAPEDKKIEPVAFVKPDLSGLELLSNSILEYARSCSSMKEEKDEKALDLSEEKLPIPEIETRPIVEDKLIGLDLLCALAEQRIKEEDDVKSVTNSSANSEARRKQRKKRKADKYLQELEAKKLKIEETLMLKETSNNAEMLPKIVDHRSYKSQESEREVHKYLASKSQALNQGDEWFETNQNERCIKLRKRMAKLQKKYKAKQQEYDKLMPKQKHSDDKHSKHKSHKKICLDGYITPPPILDKIDSVTLPNKQIDLLQPPILSPVRKGEHQETTKLIISKHDYLQNQDGTECSNAVIKNIASSKKRKAGRPRKSPNFRQLNETVMIYAKQKSIKPRSTFVGCLLAAKEKLQKINAVTGSNSPPRYIDDSVKKSKKSHKLKKLINNNNNDMAPNVVGKKHKNMLSKMRPKLKAEVTVKVYDEEEEQQEDVPKNIPSTEQGPILPVEEIEVIVQEEIPKNPFALTEGHLEMNNLAVLTVMDGVFYAGCLNAIQPPDIYSITLYGERGNRPHIMSREEVLRDSIVEIHATIKDLRPNTRVCAYWSQQVRGLYPGVIAEPSSPNLVLDSEEATMEFDDGDNGQIRIADIRLLPQDYPIMKYDPNPLMSLCKRRRRTSASIEERRSSQNVMSPPSFASISEHELKSPDTEIEKESSGTSHLCEETDNQKRKRVKKRKREKHDEKKRRHRHKLCDENCKHKKHHKKHRRHKKRHHSKSSEDKIEEEDKTTEVTEEQKELLVPLEDYKEDCDVQANDDDDTVSESEKFPEYQIVIDPENEVTREDIESKSKKRDRQESCESRSKMTAFLPAKQLWSWSGKGYKRPRAKGRSRKLFYRSIQRGKEIITVGNSAVFLSTGRADRPFIGRVESMWESCGNMVVRVKWFYHPEETSGCEKLKYPGALFESPHTDENDVQTISHKCDVLAIKEYKERLGNDPKRFATVYENNDVYYVAGYYDPGIKVIQVQKGIPYEKRN